MFGIIFYFLPVKKLLGVMYCTCVSLNRPFSYSRKESEPNDVMMQFEESSNVHNGDRSCNATRTNLAYKIV